jgi:hypothetical protein
MKSVLMVIGIETMKRLREELSSDQLDEVHVSVYLKRAQRRTFDILSWDNACGDPRTVWSAIDGICLA